MAEFERILSGADSKNHSFAKDGFTYRRAYFKDFNGQYYEVTLSIGNNGTIATVYNVGKIKEGVPPSAKILAVAGSQPLGGTPSNPIIPQDSKKSSGSVKNSSEDSSASRSLSSEDAFPVRTDGYGISSEDVRFEGNAFDGFQTAADKAAAKEDVAKDATTTREAAEEEGTVSEMEQVEDISSAFPREKMTSKHRQHSENILTTF